VVYTRVNRWIYPRWCIPGCITVVYASQGVYNGVYNGVYASQGVYNGGYPSY